MPPFWYSPERAANLAESLRPIHPDEINRMMATIRKNAQGYVENYDFEMLLTSSGFTIHTTERTDHYLLALISILFSIAHLKPDFVYEKVTVEDMLSTCFSMDFCHEHLVRFMDYNRFQNGVYDYTQSGMPRFDTGETKTVGFLITGVIAAFDVRKMYMLGAEDYPTVSQFLMEQIFVTDAPSKSTTLH